MNIAPDGKHLVI